MIIQNQHVLNMASKGQRIDNRGQDEYREIDIERNPVEKAEGSAKVTLGKTIVIAGIKMGIGKPFSDRPDEGVLMVNAEFSPIASPNFEIGPPGDDAVELARVVDRGIRESHAIDLRKLCIEKDEKVWMVNVDIHIINHSGNLIDASAMASIAALWEVRLPELKGNEINYDKKTSKRLPMTAKPVPVTFVKMEGNLFMDPGLEEEEVMEARLTVTTRDNGNIVSLQKGGAKPFTQDEIENAFALAEKKTKELRKLLN